MHAYPAVQSRTAPNFAIQTAHLTKRFGDIVAVDDLNLTVDPGEVFGFLGPNGAGKSTTIRLLLGLIRPNAGSATVFGVDVGDIRRAHQHLAYVPADVALWTSLTGAEILELLGNVGPSVDIDYRTELVTRFQLDLDRPGKAYSTGNRQKVALVAAFATRTPLLVLDEPTSGLDPLMEREFRNCVVEARERGQTVFLSSHQLAEVEAVCDRVAILRSGPIGALPVVGGFLLNVVTRGAQAPTWVVNLSPFVHLPAVPDSPPDWVASSAFAVIGAGLIALGLLGYHRRDLIT